MSNDASKHTTGRATVTRPRRIVESALLTWATLALTSCASGGNTPDECQALSDDALVFTEVFANPGDDDTASEWFELYHGGTEPLSLEGIAVWSEKTDGTGAKLHVLPAIVVEPGQYLVIGTVLDEFKPAYVAYGLGNALGALRNSEGRLRVTCGERELDRVEYGATSGASYGLSGGIRPTAASNDEPSSWCEATQDFGAGLGSPGQANEVCGGATPVTCLDGGTGRTPEMPVAGDLVINEVMANPKGADGDKEWFELLVLRDVDLNGLELGTEAGRKATLVSTNCLRTTSGSVLLFARSDDAAENGSLPAPAHVVNVSMANTSSDANPNRALWVGAGGTKIDEITYTTTTEGAAWSLDPGSASAQGNDNPESFCAAVTPYGTEGNTGSPGTINPICGAAAPCLDQGTPRAVVAPQVGDLIINEIMPNPTGTDTQREWFEVYVNSAVDLNGLELGTTLGAPKTTLASANCLAVEQGAYLLFARLATGNGDLPAPDHLFGFTLNNANGSLVLSRGGELLDAVTWTTDTDGASKALNPALQSTVSNDDTASFCPGTLTYGDGGKGTPAAANTACP